jgi:hypothetical protein
MPARPGNFDDHEVAKRRWMRSVTMATKFVNQAGGSISIPRSIAMYPRMKTSARATY